MAPIVPMYALAAALFAQTAVTGIQIRDVHFDIAASTVTYQLVNFSHKRATGWTIREYGRVGSDAALRPMGTRSLTIGTGPSTAPRMSGSGPLEPNEIRSDWAMYPSRRTMS